MKTFRMQVPVYALFMSLIFAAGCGRSQPASEPAAAAAPHVHEHEHKAPHDGTPVVLGAELYHLELVRDAATGTLQVYVLDGEMENFIRVAAPELTIVAEVHGAPQILTLRAMASGATGEIVGDTSLFEGQAEWLKTAPVFDGMLKTITIRGTTFAEVKFNFPKGNE